MRVGAGIRILAVDPAGRGVCGLALGDCGGAPELSSVRFFQDETDDHVMVFGRAADFFQRRLEEWRPNVVAIEQPLLLPNKSPGALHGIFAIAAGQARVRGIAVLPVAVQSWRKHFLGAGKLDGDVAKRRALLICKGLGWKPQNVDEAESAGVWAYACAKAAPMLAQQCGPLFSGVAL